MALGYCTIPASLAHPGSGQHRPGALTVEAVRLLATNPDQLLGFDRLRELIGMVIGDELLLLTPVSVR